MVCRVLVFTLLLLNSGCAPAKTETKGVDRTLLKDTYTQAVGAAHDDVARFVHQNLRAGKSFGYVNPYIPVVQSPVVKRVWVPDFKPPEDPGVFVGGHWVYLMLDGPRWFSQASSSDAQSPILVPARPLEASSQ